jgi:putative DNA methylase
MTVKIPKKLIEVALPLDDINDAASREKSIRHGHPSTLHLWWARRPLAAARAVIFAQMVNDPGYERHLGRGVNKEKARLERERLFDLMRRLVVWENLNDEGLLTEARDEIKKSWIETCELNKAHPQASDLFNPNTLPEFHDPFSGGGALPLEAQRLGLVSYASDLNPVAVMINKAMIEIPPKFPGQRPVGPLPPANGGRNDNVDMLERWEFARGLAEDVRRYGAWMQSQAELRLASNYPHVPLPKSLGGGVAKPLVWLWVRTVKSPNPAYAHVDVPLASSFVLSSKIGKEAYVKPIVSAGSYHFEVHMEKAPEEAKSGTKASGRGANFICLVSGTPISGDYIKAEGKEGRIGSKLMAIVAEGPSGRVYVAPDATSEQAAYQTNPSWKPSGKIPARLTGGTCVPYGITEWGDIFTQRELTALCVFSDLIHEARDLAFKAAKDAGMVDDGLGLEHGGNGAKAYAEAISVYLAFAVDRLADYWTSLGRWQAANQQLSNMFGRQAIPMMWDYPEPNPFSGKGGSFENLFDWTVQSIKHLGKSTRGFASQMNASTSVMAKNKVISTDPPYYDNIAYADLSDFFYVWMRKSLRPVFPELFSTMAVPKAEELVASAYRHGGADEAEKFFLTGMTGAMTRLAEQAHEAFPITIYYAFKQSETTDLGTASTGWETFLEAVLRAGFSITGTWPMRTEMKQRMVGLGANALASNIVLVCRKRASDAASISRRDFLRELKDELGEAVDVMIGGSEGLSPVAPVDLAQAVIGPGMAIFSKYSAVLEADGSPMTVHSALTLINKMLTEGSDDFDADTQFCLGWFDEQGWAAGDFGKADVLARAKGTYVDHVREAGVVEAVSGKVRLLRPVEYPSDWSPDHDNNTPVWEALHQLIRALKATGEVAAGELLAGMPQRADPIRNLAYRLYTLCERKGWAEDARAYNELISSWAGIEVAANEKGHYGSQMSIEE